MTYQEQQTIVEEYIAAYNRFDIDGMMKNLHPDVVFQNISGGEVTAETKGKEAFAQQAAEAKQYFNERRQTITGLQVLPNAVHVSISYAGTLAVDLPNSLKAGDVLRLNGTSVFQFQDGKISTITDSS